MRNIDQLIACLPESLKAKLAAAAAIRESVFTPFRDDQRKPFCDTWASRNKQAFRFIINENASFTAASTCRFMLHDGTIHMRMKTYRHPLKLSCYTQCREWIETSDIDSINSLLKLFCKSTSDILVASENKPMPFIIDLAFLCKE